jgi:arylsulfatase A-like enzyme
VVTDIPWADEPIGRGAFIRSVVRRAMGLGLLAGAGEMVGVAATVKITLGFDEAVVLGAVCMLLGVILSIGFAVLFGGLGAYLLRSDAVRAEARALGWVAGGLAAWHLWPAGWVLVDAQGRLPSAMAFFAMPFGVSGVVTLNARYWVRRAVRRVQDGMPSGLSWGVFSVGTAVLMVLISSFSTSGRQYGSQMALDTDPSVLLITVDTLRRDHVSVYPGSKVQTPVLEELAEEGIVFENAITPFPETAPAHSAMFTGIHPVRTGVLSNGHSLHKRYKTLAEHLSAEGYATAAFVSSFAVDARTGLDQGFQAYDDDFFPGLRGLSEIRLAKLVLRAVMRFGDPMQFRPFLERPAEDTLARALGWVRNHGQRPFFLWVHLFEPHAPYETHGAADAPDVDHSEILANEGAVTYDPELVASLQKLYAEEVAYTDAVLGDFLDGMRDVVDRPMSIIFTSDHGEMLGEHDIHFNHHGIYDETLRVPLIVVPHKGGHLVNRVSAQVRVLDIPNTVMGLLGVDEWDGVESGNLMDFAHGLQDRDFASFLMGRTQRASDEGMIFGFRAAQQNGKPGEMLKFMWQTDNELSQLFDLVNDPGETTDIAETQPVAIESMQKQVRKELGTAAPEGEGADATEMQALKVLGYIE